MHQVHRSGSRRTCHRGLAAPPRWVDIEDEAELLDDLDIETFPTLLVHDGARLRFAGVLTPQPETLRRLQLARSTGADFRSLPSLRLDCATLIASETWSHLAAAANRIDAGYADRPATSSSMARCTATSSARLAQGRAGQKHASRTGRVANALAARLSGQPGRGHTRLPRGVCHQLGRQEIQQCAQCRAHVPA